MTEIGFAGIGFIAPPTVENLLKSVLPASITGNAIGKYAVKAGTVALLSIAADKFVSAEAGKYVALGGAVYLIANAVVEFAPQIFSGFSGYPVAGQRVMPRLGMRGQPMLGRYMGSYLQGAPHSSVGIADRLNAGNRF